MYNFEKEFPINKDLDKNLLSAFHLNWPGCLDKNTVDQIIQVGNNGKVNDAKIGSPNNQSEYHKIRKSKVGWIYREGNEDLFNKIIECMVRANYHYFGFKIDSTEALQYSIYEDDGHYNYHHDIHFTPGYTMRKLSASFCLSRADEYEGGELELIHYGDHEQNYLSFKMGCGDMIAFPSFVTHRILPVTSGTRRSIVVWASGPKFI